MTHESEQTSSTRVGSGYVAYIDQLLRQVADVPLGHVQRGRSVYSVNDAVRLVLLRFPEKNPASVKKVVKARPRHLEKQKSNEFYDDTLRRAPRWKWVGPGVGTGYIRRIDEMLAAGGRTQRDIATIVCAEFGKDIPSALSAVRVRCSLYRRRTGTEPQFVRVSTIDTTPRAIKRERIKRMNQELLKKESKRRLARRN